MVLAGQAARCPIPVHPGLLPSSICLTETRRAAEAAPCWGSPCVDPPLRERLIPPPAPSENVCDPARIC